MENSGRSPFCQVAVSHEGASSSTLIGASNYCEWLFKEGTLTPWCHLVARFEVKMSHFSAFLGGTIVQNIQDHSQWWSIYVASAPRAHRALLLRQVYPEWVGFYPITEFPLRRANPWVQDLCKHPSVLPYPFPTPFGSSSTLIGLSNDCKWLFNESLTLWCQAVDHCEVKLSHFSTKFFDQIWVQWRFYSPF